MQVANFHSLNVVIASVSGIGGLLSGAILARATTRGIERKGEYHPSRNRLVLVLGVGLVVGAGLVYLIESGAISFSILSQFMSGTSSESDRGPETWRKKLLPTRHDMLIRRKQGNVRTDAQPCFNEAIGASIQLEC